MGIIVSLPRKIISQYILYEAIERNFLSTRIIQLLCYASNVDDSIVATGRFAGITVLHLACIKNNFELAKFLIQNCKANVNVKAKDGTQPIHLAYFLVQNFHTTNILQALVEAGANVDAEFGRNFFFRCEDIIRKRWSEEFGDRITLLTYAIFNDEADLTRCLIQQGANYKIKSLTNRTLLMLALEYNHFSSAFEILKLEKIDPEFINARDDKRMTAIRYILHPMKFGMCRHTLHQIESLWSFDQVDSLIKLLIYCGSTIELPLKDRPDSILLNLAAYRSSSATLRALLPFDFPVNECKTLYYATLPVDEDSWEYLGIPVIEEDDYCRSHIKAVLQRQRKCCLQIILSFLVIRQSFSIPVSKDEITLMEKLIATDTEVKNYVDEIRRILNDRLKKKIIKIGDENMSLDAFVAQVYNYRKLKILFNKDSNILDVWERSKYINSNEYYLQLIVFRHISQFILRIKLLEMLKKVSQLRQYIPLPYECILEIVEYLYNEDLDKFIKAFEYL